MSNYTEVIDLCEFRNDTCFDTTTTSSSGGGNKLSKKAIIGGAAGGLGGVICLFGGLTLALMAYRRNHGIESVSGSPGTDGQDTFVDENAAYNSPDTQQMTENQAFEMQTL